MANNNSKKNQPASLIQKLKKMTSSVLSYLKKNKKRSVILIILILILLIIVSRANKQPEGLTVETVSRKALKIQVSANGEIKAEKSVDLKFLSPGKISWVGVKNGDKVRAWQAVAKLDTTTLNANYMIALNNLRGSNASTDSVLDSVQGHVTDETFAIRAERTDSEVEKDNAYEAVIAAQDALKNATLVTPFSGTVVETGNLVAGQVLTASDLTNTYIRITDLESLYFEADLDEIDYEKVSLEQDVDIFIDAYPNDFCEGKVYEISQQGVQKSGGVTTILVKIGLQNCPYRLLSGLNGQAKFVTSKIDDALVIPKKYLIDKDDSYYVWLKKGDNLKKRELVQIQTGTESSSEIEVTSGLNEGNEIIFIPQI